MALANLGKKEAFSGTDITEWRKFKGQLQNELDGKLLEIRSAALGVGEARRNFALLDYSDRRNFDALLAVIYPFHYWHSRTYVNWMKRIATNPGIVSKYASYREALEDVHAGQQDWWKHQINTNELLGLNSKNPLYFNLEATLNPLNGITGIDFNDPVRRQNMWTAVLDDLGKLGPSVWTPYAIATAMILAAQGEEEAAALWAGRFIPQTQTLGAAISILEEGVEGTGFEGVGNVGLLDSFITHSNFDPFLSYFTKSGTDKYTENRIGRALGAMRREGFVLDGEPVTDEEFIESARTMSGPLWEAAHKRAIHERAPGQLGSFIAGVGFKGRSVSDMETDAFYNDYYKFLNQTGNLSQEEVRQGYDQLRQQYPFMDTLLLARKAGTERDRTYAYGVLGRIPPGDKNAIAKAAGLDPRLIDKFYEDKGYLETWKEDERLRFQSAVLTLGSILEIPDDGTKQEWTAARNQMTVLRNEMEARWGESIHTDIDLFFQQEDDDKDEFLAGHPAVEEAMDWKAAQIAGAPESFAATYYGGIDQIEKFYKGMMYNEIDEKVPNVDKLWDEYWAIPDKKVRSAYWDANPGLQTYIDIRDKWDGFILKQMDELGSRLKEGEPVQLRETEDASIFAEDVQEFVETPPAVSDQEIMISALRFGGDALIENIDLWQSRGSMSATTQAALEKVAEDLGISFSELLETLR